MDADVSEAQRGQIGSPRVRQVGGETQVAAVVAQIRQHAHTRGSYAAYTLKSVCHNVRVCLLHCTRA